MVKTPKEQIEELIDQQGLSGLLDSIADIANEKADHIRASYEGDSDPTAKAWYAAADVIRDWSQTLNTMGF